MVASIDFILSCFFRSVNHFFGKTAGFHNFFLDIQDPPSPRDFLWDCVEFCSKTCGDIFSSFTNFILCFLSLCGKLWISSFVAYHHENSEGTAPTPLSQWGRQIRMETKKPFSYRHQRGVPHRPGWRPSRPRRAWKWWPKPGTAGKPSVGAGPRPGRSGHGPGPGADGRL